jgi:hypothetical protein
MTATGRICSTEPGEKALAVLRFVSERTPPAEKPKWTELWRSWNSECRDGEYPRKWSFNDISALRRAYLRAEQSVAASWVVYKG